MYHAQDVMIGTVPAKLEHVHHSVTEAIVGSTGCLGLLLCGDAITENLSHRYHETVH